MSSLCAQTCYSVRNACFRTRCAWYYRVVTRLYDAVCTLKIFSSWKQNVWVTNAERWLHVENHLNCTIISSPWRRKNMRLSKPFRLPTRPRSRGSNVSSAMHWTTSCSFVRPLCTVHVTKATSVSSCNSSCLKLSIGFYHTCFGEYILWALCINELWYNIHSQDSYCIDRDHAPLRLSFCLTTLKSQGKTGCLWEHSHKRDCGVVSCSAPKKPVAI